MKLNKKLRKLFDDYIEFRDNMNPNYTTVDYNNYSDSYDNLVSELSNKITLLSKRPDKISKELFELRSLVDLIINGDKLLFECIDNFSDIDYIIKEL